MKKNEMGAAARRDDARGEGDGRNAEVGTPTNPRCNAGTLSASGQAGAGPAGALHICSFNYKPHIPDWRCVWCGKDARRAGEVKK